MPISTFKKNYNLKRVGWSICALFFFLFKYYIQKDSDMNCLLNELTESNVGHKMKWKFLFVLFWYTGLSDFDGSILPQERSTLFKNQFRPHFNVEAHVSNSMYLNYLCCFLLTAIICFVVKCLQINK